VCDPIIHDWYYRNGGTAANYGAYHDEDNWSLTADVDAKAVSAYVDVSSWPASSWEETGTLSGSATVTAYRAPYNVSGINFHYRFSCNRHYAPRGYCMGHRWTEQIEAAIDTNNPDPGMALWFNGEPTDISLTVQVNASRSYKIVKGETVSTKQTVSAEVSADYKFVKGTSQFISEFGLATAQSISDTITTNRTAVEVNTEDQYRSASVDFVEEASSCATADFSFQSASSLGAVAYEAP